MSASLPGHPARPSSCVCWDLRSPNEANSSRASLLQFLLCKDMTQLHYIATRGGNQFPRCLGLQPSFSPWSGVLLGKAFKRANSFSVPSVPGSRCQTSYPCFPEVLGDCNFGWQLRNRQNTELPSRTKPSMAAQCRAEPLHHRLHLYKGVNKSLSERTSGLVRSARHV